MTGGFRADRRAEHEASRRSPWPWRAWSPLSLGLTIWQLITQKGVRLGLLRCPREDGRHRGPSSSAGLDYVRAADTDGREIARVEAEVAEARRATELRHHFEMSPVRLGQGPERGAVPPDRRRLRVGLCAAAGTISYGDILMFSVLFLNVMTPLNEIHRFVDETHECSPQGRRPARPAGPPEDRSFAPVSTRASRAWRWATPCS